MRNFYGFNQWAKPITKKELEATKQELLGRLASKDDLKQFATKKDFEIIASQVVNLTHRMTTVENQLSVVQDTTNLILETVDGIAKKIRWCPNRESRNEPHFSAAWKSSWKSWRKDRNFRERSFIKPNPCLKSIIFSTPPTSPHRARNIHQLGMRRFALLLQ